ncbi:MAG TPA: biotin--[acetyl-CoA-carboxylase] ligase [Bacillota bacterium]|nr:biotin--[acetyl-CoA-carboxylase] ligase [Bacillota bacterium]
MLNQTTAQVLEMLLAETRVSGESIAAQLGLSRAAVWKNIEILRSIGYEVDSAPGQGYRILASPDIPLPQEVRRFTAPSPVPWTVEYLSQCSSTNTLLKERAASGAPEGAVLVTNHQTEGRGRRGRQWTDIPDGALLFSVLFRPPLPPTRLMPLTLIMGVAVAQALSSLGVSCTLKWPNDILVNGFKLSGILTEISGELDHTDYAVVGIGINVRGQPDLVEYGATSLEEHIQPPGRAEILAVVLAEIARYYTGFLAGDTLSILDRWETMSATLHREVVAHTPSGDIHGTAIGVDADGALIVRTGDGEHIVISTGEVSLRHQQKSLT